MCGSTMEKNVHNQQWRPPNVGSLKFNVDGAARGKPGPAGIGGLLRNNCSAVVAMFSIPLGVLDSNVVEVMAIKEACRMVNEKLDLSSSGIIVESDSLNAVSWVRHPFERSWRLLSHFQEIDLFLSSNGNRSIAHIKSEGNCDAVKLAREDVLRSIPLSIWNL
ncbi:reverse transcriptase [Artemisia annua]|uniref:Reverse transcriptase n=1 Tax=Artemisia annua TaxID=35608 RepID=A0A2U1L8W0_ARTAN|nr:reverse transcriptase [Artemisia annua]